MMVYVGPSMVSGGTLRPPIRKGLGELLRGATVEYSCPTRWLLRQPSSLRRPALAVSEGDWDLVPKLGQFASVPLCGANE